MPDGIYAYKLTALAPWAWHGLAAPSGTATLNDVVTDTAVAFAAAAALGMAPRAPCLPSAPDYAAHLAGLPFRTSLFMGRGNGLLRPLARRLNLDAECGLPAAVDNARKSGNIKDYFHVQEVAPGATFHGFFLLRDPLRLAEEAYGEGVPRLVVRLGLGRAGMGLLEPAPREQPQEGIRINLHTARLFDPDIAIEAESYLLHSIQPSRPLEPDHALRVVSGWSGPDAR